LQQLLQLLLELLQFRLLLQNADGGGTAATAGDRLSCPNMWEPIVYWDGKTWKMRIGIRIVREDVIQCDGE
jgi:hypothetical protein